MRIAIEMGQIVPGACGGIVPLLQGVLTALFDQHPDCIYDLYCTVVNQGLFSSVPSSVRLHELPQSQPDYYARLDHVCMESRPDVLFRSYPLDIALGYPSLRQIVLIPDMQHDYFPEFFDPYVLQVRRNSFHRALAESGAIATISEHARATILAHPSTNTRDVFLMPPALPHTGAVSAPLTATERQLVPVGDYFLMPGNLWPHKNHHRTLQAFQRYVATTNHRIELILTGHPAGWEELIAHYPGLPVRHLGFVRRNLLQSLMKQARALVFFSLFEGFGMPLLEAFHAGVPVVCSNTTSLPEVGDDAILSCNPTDVSVMSDCLERIQLDQALRERLIAAGRERLNHYTWERSAKNLIASCRRVASAPPVPPRPVPAFRERVKASLPPGASRVLRAVAHPWAVLLPALQRSIAPVLGKVTQRVRRSFISSLGVHFQYPPRPMRAPAPFRRPLPNPAPQISIVTPSFNHAAFLERTMRSVLDQNYPALEYIIQDGGSTDGTHELLSRFHDQLSHCESRRDKGQANAINLGFRNATGELMGYLNSDDLLLPGALACVAHYFHTHPSIDVIYGNRIIIDQYDREVGRWVLPPHDNVVLSWNDYVPQETLFWRRWIWERVGGIDESFQFALDWDLLLRFRDAGARIVRVPRFLGAFRVHPLQKTSAHMADLGQPEIDRLRERSIGRPVTEEEVQRVVRPYLRRHVWYRLLNRLGVSF
jgi:glycosyltransferase involved in cell wall biosynthesis